MMMPNCPSTPKELVAEAERQAWSVTDLATGWLCLPPGGDATIYVLDAPDPDYLLNCLALLRRAGLRLLDPTDRNTDT
jgi:hypothetical protein